MNVEVGEQGKEGERERERELLKPMPDNNITDTGLR